MESIYNSSYVSSSSIDDFSVLDVSETGDGETGDGGDSGQVGSEVVEVHDASLESLVIKCHDQDFTYHQEMFQSLAVTNLLIAFLISFLFFKSIFHLK